MSLFRLFLKTPPEQFLYRLKYVFNKSKSLDEFSDIYPCVFVLSTGRVGTESLSHLFKNANNIVSYHEPYPRLYSLSKIAYKYQNNDFFVKIASELLKQSRADLISDSLNSGLGYVETSPQSTFLASTFKYIIPNVKFIHLVRNPSSFIQSGLRRGWYVNNVHDVTRIEPLENSSFYSNWKSFSQLEKIAWLWAETNNSILDFKSSLSDNNYLFIKYEDIFISKNIDHIKSMFDFINSTVPSESKLNKLINYKYNSQKKNLHITFEYKNSNMNKDLNEYVKKICNKLNYI